MDLQGTEFGIRTQFVFTFRYKGHMIKFPPNFSTRESYPLSLLCTEKQNLYKLAHMRFDEKENTFFD